MLLLSKWISIRFVYNQEFYSYNIKKNGSCTTYIINIWESDIFIHLKFLPDTLIHTHKHSQTHTNKQPNKSKAHKMVSHKTFSVALRWIKYWSLAFQYLTNLQLYLCKFTCRYAPFEFYILFFFRWAVAKTFIVFLFFFFYKSELNGSDKRRLL